MKSLTYLGRTVIDFPFTTKWQRFFHIGFVLVSSSFPPGSQDDVGNVWRKVLLCEGVRDNGQTIKCTLLCSGCGSLKWAWHSRFADGLRIHGWLYNSCRTSGNHVCVGHTGISSIPCALSCKMFAHTLESD